MSGVAANRRDFAGSFSLADVFFYFYYYFTAVRPPEGRPRLA